MPTKEESVIAVQDILGYTFKNSQLLWLALQAAGSGIGEKDGNKRLAKIGHAIMNLVLVDEFYHDGLSRGSMTNIAELTCQNENLADVCISSELGSYINKNPGQTGNTPPPKTLSATVEAVLAACYIDSERDMAITRNIMGTLGLRPSNISD